ncbi:MAG: polyphenol oxidase family protein [Candidatus Saccharimonadales bacterium]
MTTLQIACSTTLDGSMKIGDSFHPEEIGANREKFLKKNDMTLEQMILVPLTYTGDNYRRYFTVGKDEAGEGITKPSTKEADGLLTTEAGLSLFLPLADCIGTVLYDAKNGAVMLTHLGRHNLEQEGGRTSVEYMVQQCGSDLRDITAWLSPAAGGVNYPLFGFDNRSMHDVAIEQLLSAGVLRENITASPIDTTTDPKYFSHSQFLKGEKDSDGRFAVVAVLYED